MSPLPLAQPFKALGHQSPPNLNQVGNPTDYLVNWDTGAGSWGWPSSMPRNRSALTITAKSKGGSDAAAAAAAALAATAVAFGGNDPEYSLRARGVAESLYKLAVNIKPQVCAWWGGWGVGEVYGRGVRGVSKGWVAVGLLWLSPSPSYSLHLSNNLPTPTPTPLSYVIKPHRTSPVQRAATAPSSPASKASRRAATGGGPSPLTASLMTWRGRGCGCTRPQVCARACVCWVVRMGKGGMRGLGVPEKGGTCS